MSTLSKPAYLSAKTIPPRERLIFALDVSSTEEARSLVDRLGDSIQFYKLGLQLFMAGEYYPLIKWLRDRDKNIMVDLKFFDVPETVRLAVQQLKNRGVTFATVHGNEDILRAAVEEKDEVRILAVTVLTSMDNNDLHDLGFPDAVDVRGLVLSRARRALQVGCDGVISSGLEAADLRDELGQNFLIVTPGIRPVANTDDQKRTVNVEAAFRSGADYIVVGRPVRDAHDPRVKAEEIQTEITSLFS